MPIRPIDLQVIVPKANSNPVGREHVVHKEAMQLQQTQMENKKESTERDKKVNATDRKDGGKVSEKRVTEKKEGGSKRQAADQKKAKDSSKAPENKEKDKKPEAKGWDFHRFDMKV